MPWSAEISRSVLRPLNASMATLALNSGLWVRLLLIGGSPFQGWCPASKANDKSCSKTQTTSNRAQGLESMIRFATADLEKVDLVA
jgi:hypothetical protein